MGVGRIMKLFRISSLVFLVVPVFLTGCTTCQEIKVSTSTQGEWSADVRHRVCDSYSGYAVAVYEISEGPPGNGEGDKEPFQAMYKTEDFIEGLSPITIEWKTDNNLVIHHDTRQSIDDDRSKPMITKADMAYQGVIIEYDPEPVIWEK